ncbi:MAG: hypothetical protein H6Q58_1785 [Firmicutes bacterium]|nr:hypothetical protein [Bacillota bacterium]
MKKGYIITVSLAACIMLYVLEQILAVDYATKTAAKALLFTAAPFIYLKIVEKTSLKDSLSLVKLKGAPYGLELLLGAASFTGVFGMYILLGGYIDFDVILNELRSKAQIDVSNYVFIGIYIIIGNSFLEELFFRGFIFLNLFKQGHRKLAYIYSSALFGIYHLAMLNTWISPLLLGLAVTGLTIIGLVFDWLDSRSGNIVNSWIVHMLADCALIIIGMNMFNII